MTAAALLADLRQRGVAVRADGDRLRCRPADRLTAADVDALRALKGELLPLLRDVASLGADGTAGRLRALYDDLTAAERLRLADNARHGDRLAGLLLLAVDPEASA